MTQHAYPAVLTVAWAGAIALRPSGGWSPALLLPATAVAGAWLAAFDRRVGHTLFVAASGVIVGILALVLLATLLPGVLLFIGGRTAEMGAVLATAAVLAALIGLHVWGMAGGLERPAA